jgi:hypothetical protein
LTETTGEPGLRWFVDSPNAGDPACLCSLCGEVIPEEDEEGEVVIPIRVWDRRAGRTALEARFHPNCWTKYLAGTQAAPDERKDERGKP